MFLSDLTCDVNVLIIESVLPVVLCHRSVLHVDSGRRLTGLTGDVKRTVHQKQRTPPHRKSKNIIHAAVSVFWGLHPGDIYFKKSVFEAFCSSKHIISIRKCKNHFKPSPDVPLQEAPDFVNSLSLKVEVQQENTDANPVLARSSLSAWEFFVSNWAATPSLTSYCGVFLRVSPGMRAEDSPVVLQTFTQPFRMTQLIAAFWNLNCSREVSDTRVLCLSRHNVTKTLGHDAASWCVSDPLH